MAEQDGRAADTKAVELERPPRDAEPPERRPEDKKPEGAGKKPDDKPPPRPFHKRPLLMLFLLLLVVGAGVGGYFYYEYAKQFESTDDAFMDAHIVQMDSKVTGYVVKLLVDDNQLVEAGQVLVEIDPRDYRAALDQSESAERAAKAKVDQADAQIAEGVAALSTAKSNIAAAAAKTGRDKAELGRLDKLKGSGSITAQEYDVGASAAKSSLADENAMRAMYAEAEAKLATNKAALATAKAQLEQAAAKSRADAITLSYTKITAPIPGRVTRRTVEQGNLLQPGTSLFALVEQRPWVTANFKETQLTLMKPGQAVEIAIDAYPDRHLAATIDSFQRGSGQRFSLLPPENATGNYVKVVQRIPVKILFREPPPADMILGPGMSVVPTVKVQ